MQNSILFMKESFCQAQEARNTRNNQKVEGPTWISPLVVIPKRNCEVCLCIDMRMVNRTIQRERGIQIQNLICDPAIISWSYLRKLK